MTTTWRVACHANEDVRIALGTTTTWRVACHVDEDERIVLIVTTTWRVACHAVVRMLLGYDMAEDAFRDGEGAELRGDDVVDRGHDGDHARSRLHRWRPPLALPGADSVDCQVLVHERSEVRRVRWGGAGG